MNKPQITIIGGYGLMGQLFTSLFSSIGINVNKIGPNDWEHAPDILSQSDLVIVSVPIHLTNQIISQTAKYLTPDCILADFTSIKVEPLLSMLREHSGPILGMHPMFGPTIKTTNKQVIAYSDGRYPDKYQWVITTLIHLGFTLKKLTASEHDQSMNFIQGIEHFLTFSLGSFLHQKQQHPQQLIELSSPIYLAKLLLMGRIFDQDPALYADIIMATPSRIELIREFSNWLTMWVDKLEKNNKTEFIDEFIRVKQWMGSFTAHAQKVSDNFLTVDFNLLINDKKPKG